MADEGTKGGGVRRRLMSLGPSKKGEEEAKPKKKIGKTVKKKVVVKKKPVEKSVKDPSKEARKASAEPGSKPDPGAGRLPSRGDASPEHKSDGPQALRELETEDLKPILEKHREWIATKSQEGVRAELAKPYLRGSYLQGAKLCGADLRDCNLQKSKLQNADVFLADLHNADLREANLESAIHRGQDAGCRPDGCGSNDGRPTRRSRRTIRRSRPWI